MSESRRQRAAHERLLKQAQAERDEAQLEVRRMQRKYAGAERAIARLSSEQVTANDSVERIRGKLRDKDRRIAELGGEIDRLQGRLRQAGIDLRHATDREEAAATRQLAAEARIAELSAALAAAEAELRDSRAATTAAAGAGRRSSGDGDDGGRLRLPGGVAAQSAEGIEFLLRAGAPVLIDGYNVAKTGWPTRPLEGQRDALVVLAEQVVMRFGTDLTVVFDGAGVIGAHRRRRTSVRVEYSTEGVIADDVLRARARSIRRQGSNVVVVTDDRALLADLEALGARTIGSRRFLQAVTEPR